MSDRLIIRTTGSTGPSGSGGSTALDDLTDVTITSATSGQVLKYNGSAWVNGTDSTGSGSGTLDDLTDVTITAAASGDILRHNGTAWVDAVGTTHFEAAGGIATHAAVTSSVHGISAFGATLVDDADASTARTTLGLAIGSNVQAFDTDLAAIAALTSAADKMLYATGAGTWALADLSAAGRAILDDANAAAQRTTLGLAIGTDVQAYDADLAALAAISPSQGDIIYHNGTAWVRLAAGTSGHYLQTQGTGANPQWAAASGGSSIGAGQSFQVAASYVPASIFTDVASFTNNVLAANEVHYIPLILDAAATADRIGISVHTAAAGGEVARLAIYNTANGRPTTVLLDAGTVAVDSTGVKEITISQALSAGVLYALAVHFKVNTQVHCFGGQSSVESVYGFQAVSTRAAGATYGSGLPASPTITTNAGKNPPVIRVRLT